MLPDQGTFWAQSRLFRLLQDWTQKRRRIDEKHSKIAALGSSEGLTAALIQKVSGWLNQIAGLREKELDIISEIGEIEKKHLFLRKTKKLRRAAPAPIEAPEEEKPRKSVWFKLLIFMMLTSERQRRRNEVR